MQNLSSLINLAHDKSDESRLELVKLTSQEFLGCKDELSEQQLALFTSIINQLYSYLPNGVKSQLANALSINSASPENILATIAEDDIEFAGPILSFSTNLSDDTLIGVIKKKGFDHQLLIARRPNLGEIVTDALADTQNTEIATEVGKNLTAKISKESYDKYLNLLKDNVDSLGLFAVRTDVPDELSGIINDSFKKNFITQSNDNHIMHHTVESAPYVGEISTNDCMKLLQSGNSNGFIHHCATHFSISATKLKDGLDSGDLQNFIILARALDLDVKSVESIRNIYLKNSKPLNQQENKDTLIFWITITSSRAVSMLHEKYDD
jgi:hypothetical protein